MIWSNIPLKFSVILWMHWGPSSSHYFLYQAQGTHQRHQTKLVKPCPYYHFNFLPFPCDDKFCFDSVSASGSVMFWTSMSAKVKSYLEANSHFLIWCNRWLYLPVLWGRRRPQSPEQCSCIYICFYSNQAPWLTALLRKRFFWGKYF